MKNFKSNKTLLFKEKNNIEAMCKMNPMKSNRSFSRESNLSTGKILAAALSLLFLVNSAQAQVLDHQEKMWGLKNTGQPIVIDLDPLQSYRLQGVAGEDINLPPAVRGKRIKVAVIDTGVDISHAGLKNNIYKNASKCEAYTKLTSCLAENGSDEQSCREQHLQASENVYPADCHGWSVLDFFSNDRLSGRNPKTGEAVSGLKGNLPKTASDTASRNGNYTPNQIIGRPNFTDEAGHGTHVAGIIRSVSDNVEIIPVQVVGIGPNQPLKPYAIDLAPSESVRGGYKTDFNLTERVARGIIYAMNSGAQVINLSLGWPEGLNTDIIKEAIAEAQRRGIIIVAAAGNDSTSAILRPCQYKGVICVAAHRPDGAIASFSNFGLGVDIAAPGVEILSTIPMNQGAVRLPGFKGYDYLSGTSQAAPYVAGVVADMLARGIPTQEIYPRLILGARAVRPDAPVLKGPVNKPGTPVASTTSYKKNILSGLLDMTRALQVQAQPLLLPADKETAVIEWDRHSSDISFQFKIKNYWAALSPANVSLRLKSNLGLVSEPKNISLSMPGSASIWAQNEERTATVKLNLLDASGQMIKRIPSELSYTVDVLVNGQLHRQFEIKAEIITLFTKETVDQDLVNIPIEGAVPQGFDISPVTEILDGKMSQKDYILISGSAEGNSAFNVALMKMNQGRYQISQTQTIEIETKSDIFRPRNKLRIDIDGDGQSEYVIVVYDYLDSDRGIDGPYRNHLVILNHDFTFRETILFDDLRMALPFKFFWMKLGQNMRPAWVARGPEIKSKWDITDLWGVEKLENVPTKKDIRFYYLDEKFKLKHITVGEGLKIVDVIQPTATQLQQGSLPVLLARNLGTEVKPSYLNNFSIGYVNQGQLTNQKALTNLNSGVNYRNLIDTFADSALTTSSTNTEYRGTMWYGLDTHQRQRITILDLEDFKFYDKTVQSQRIVFDAALLVKAGFVSKDRAGAFLFTNSELEFHDLNSNQVSTRSLNRYTFYGDQLFVENHFALTLVDRQNPNLKHPALFTTEGAGLNRTMKIMMPIYEGQQVSKAIITPARLNFKSAKGCRSLPTPLYLGEQAGYAMDYYCGDQIRRLILKY